ncbi:MAG TPA: hypothetical protein PK812_02280 [Beijerinckiaceae bacterium]|nr:hypothetical protein [Beijerinckiaceae bacterium]
MAQLLSLIVLIVVVFGIVNFVHFRLLPVRVVLYDAVLDLVVAFVICLLLYGLFRRSWGSLSGMEAMLAMAVGFLIGLFYAISIPTVVDRSLSIYILEKVAQRGGAIREDALGDIFINEYMPEHRLVDIRLTEQLNSATITVENGCIRLTERGRRIAEMTRWYRAHILPRHRELRGELTDALTDPFRHSKTDVTYQCR